MPAHRKPLALAHLTGAVAKNPQRYRARHEPIDDRPLGEPFSWLKPEAQAAWRELAPTLPWLRHCHRGIVGITAMLAGKLRRGELGIAGQRLLMSCLGSLGATPASAAKIGWVPPEPEDPADDSFR